VGKGEDLGSHLQIPEQPFRLYFDRKPFYIRHNLGEHPLFALDQLAALSRRLPPEVVECNEGHSGAYGRPELTRQASLPCDQAILNVQQRPCWVLLRQVQRDPVYGPLMDELLAEIRPHSEPLRPGMCRPEGFIFVSSRQAVTPYHFDPEHNFLLQIRGRKTVHMWDPEDRFVLPEPAIDAFYCDAADNRNQPYDDRFLTTAWVLPLPAGQGVHFPLHAPHWVRTDSDVSISFSVTFRSRESNRRELLHLANGRLRKLGLRPPGVGRWALWDAGAHLGIRVAEKLRRRLGTGPSAA
jgi:hypothetical protein